MKIRVIRVSVVKLFLAAALLRYEICGLKRFYPNVGLLVDPLDIEELHVGHSIVSRAIFVGMQRDVAKHGLPGTECKALSLQLFNFLF